ncbi:hypothetical protein EP331_02590 [bacterium]|nr:MAG: hypothetical protein EP331_02590 [bacterium]
MSGKYRNLLKKASVHVRLGKQRFVLTGASALILLIFSLIQWRFDLGIMSALLGFISWQYYETYTLSNSVFESLEELNKQFNRLEDLPE